MNVGTLTVTMGVNTAGLVKAQQSVIAVQSSMATFSKNSIASLNTISQRFRTFGYLATAALTMPIVMAGKAAIKMSLDYEASLSKVIGLVGVAKDQVNAWSVDILKMAPEVAKSPKELADALYFITSAGIRGAEAMDVLKMSAMGSAAGLGDTKTVADLVTSAMNAYGIANLSAAQATDILTATVREGKAEASALASTMGMVLPIASAMGVTFDQVGAGIAAMTRTGTSAATSAMQLRQILNSLIKPSQGAESALIAMGTSSTALRKTIREDGLLAALMDINALTKKYGETTMSKVFPNIRALSGVLDIMGKNLEDNIKIFNSLEDSTGSLIRAFSAASDTMKFKFNVATSAAQVAMKKIGDYIAQFILPIFEWLAKQLTKLSAWFDSLSEAQRRNRLILILIVAALGPLSLLISLIGYSLSALAVAFNVVTAAVWRLNAAMAINPMTAAVGILIYLAARAWLRYRGNIEKASSAQYTMNNELKRGKDLMVELNALTKQAKAAELMSLEQVGGVRSKYQQALAEEKQLTIELAAEAIKRIEGDKKVAYLKEQILNATNEMYKAGLLGQLQARKVMLTADLDLEYLTSQKRIALIEKAQARINAIFGKKDEANTAAENWLEAAREIDEIFNNLAKRELYISRMTALLGDEFDTAKEKTKLYSSILSELADTTIPLTDSRMRELAKAVGLVNTAVTAIKKEDMMKAFGFGDTLVPGPKPLVIDFDVETMQILQEELGQIALKSAWMGDTWDVASAQARALESTIDALNAAYPEGGAEIEALVNQYKGLVAMQDEVGFSAKRMGNILSNAITDMAYAIGDAFVNTQGAALALVGVILQTGQQIVAMLLAEAIAATIAKNAIFPGGLVLAAIGIGVLMAMYANAQTKASQAVKMAGGGVVPPGYPKDTYPALLSSGEKVTPPGKLNSLGIEGGVVEFRIKDNYLVGILEKYGRKVNSYN